MMSWRLSARLGIRTTGLLTPLVIAGVLWVAAAENVYACVCSGSPEPPTDAQLTGELRRDLDAARAVFVGEAIGGNSLTIRFRVEWVWKGELGREVVMATGTEATPDGALSTSSCDMSFAFGRRYLVFANGKTNETMKARACTFSGAAENKLLALLDTVTARRPPSPSVTVKALMAVIGAVRRPGVIQWREGLTVAEALVLAGGLLSQVSPQFAAHRLPSRIYRWRAGAPPERLALSPTAMLLQDDELFVSDELVRDR